MMQDRFKFRIFEKPTKIMHELNAVGYSDFDPYMKGISRLIMIPAGIENSLAYNKTCLYNSDNFSDPMQSTGLKDKNGKLIYENDIIKTNFDNDEIIGVITWSCDEQIGFYINTTDYFGDKYLTNFDLYADMQLEVIGNIYETPELLEVGE